MMLKPKQISLVNCGHWILPASLIAVCYSGGMAAEPATVREAWRAFLEGRTTVESIVLHAEIQVVGAPQSVEPRRHGSTTTYHLWSDLSDGKYRCDWSELRPNDTERVPERRFASIGDTIRAAPDLNQAVAYETLHSLLQKDPLRSNRIENKLQEELTLVPLAIGLSPSPFAAFSRRNGADLAAIQALFESAGDTPLTVQDGPKGVELHASFSPPGSGAVLDYVFDPARDCAPVRCTVTADSMPSGEALVQTLESEWSEHAVNGSAVWLLSSAQFIARRRGDILNEERWLVEVDSINEPIDDDLFGWTAMGLTEGGVVERRGFGDAVRQVVELRSGDFKPWEPKPIVQSRLDDRGTTFGVERWVQWLIAANIFVIGATAALILIRRRVHRGRTT